MERKKIGKGSESFEKLISENKYYVDKTDFIQTVFGDSGSEVFLITRPRRFGKTLTMRTFESFLSLNPDNPGDVSKQLRLFAGTRILSEEGSAQKVSARKRFVRENMGKYPVIFLTFKDVDGADFEEAYQAIAAEMNLLVGQFGYLRSSPRLSDEQKREYAQLENSDFLEDVANKGKFRTSLKRLTLWLTLHHGVKPVILIDEYDVPLAKAQASGYYGEMLNLLRGFYGALKTNDYFSRAVLTGCLRVSKESFFTGLNSFSPNSIFDREDEKFSAAIGFTADETDALLDYYGLGKYKLQIRDNYDGYRFGRVSMFCPWDVISFCSDAVAITDGSEPLFKNYWTNTSGNQIIDEFSDYITPEHVDDMQTLVDGGTVSVTVRQDLNYPDMEQHEIDAFWTMLLFTGYLTVTAESSLDLRQPQQVRIPNLEIRECFSGRILKHFKSNPRVVNDSLDLARAFLSGDPEKAGEIISRKLRSFISVRDLASRSPYEDVYHSFLNGCFSSCNGVIAYYSTNREAGEGYPDISFMSDNSDTAVVIELKQTGDESVRDALADSALEQIEERKYAAEFLAQRNIKTVFAYGICFCRKSCSVSLRKLR